MKSMRSALGLRISGWMALLALLACGCFGEDKGKDDRELLAAVMHGDRVTGVAFSSDARYLASASKDNTIRILEVENYHQSFTSVETVRELPKEIDASPIVGHGNGFGAVAFVPGKPVLASGSHYYVAEGTVQLFDVETGAELAQANQLGPWIRSLRFDPAGDRLAVASGEGLLLGQVTLLAADTLTTGEAFGAAIGGIFDAAFSPDGLLVASAANDGQVALWNASDGSLRTDLTIENHLPYAVAFSPDGRTLASAGEDNGIVFSGGPGVIRLWDVETGELIRSLDLGAGPIRTLAFAPDGSLLAAGGDDHVIYLIDPASGVLVDSMKGHLGRINCLAIAGNGMLLASGSDDRYLRIWYIGDLAGLNCADGIDNDGDGWADAKDPDCAGGVREKGPGAAECNDASDNDDDGLIDAADPDCIDGFDDSEAPLIDIDAGPDSGLDAGA